MIGIEIFKFVILFIFLIWFSYNDYKKKSIIKWELILFNLIGICLNGLNYYIQIYYAILLLLGIWFTKKGYWGSADTLVIAGSVLFVGNLFIITIAIMGACVPLLFVKQKNPPFVPFFSLILFLTVIAYLYILPLLI